jgi:hypothetical protein
MALIVPLADSPTFKTPNKPLPAYTAEIYAFVRATNVVTLLRLELARSAAGSKLPAKQSGSKLPHSKACAADITKSGIVRWPA